MADDDDDIASDLAKFAAQMRSVAKDAQQWADAAKQGDEAALRELKDVGLDLGSLDKAATQMAQGGDRIEQLQKMWYGDENMESQVYRYVSTVHGPADSGFVAFTLKREEGGGPPFGVCLLVTEAEQLVSDLSVQINIAKQKPGDD
jgi:hypothetical protein